MKKEPKLSIIVPIYNCEQYISKCLNSILSQKYNNLEILLIDDGSTDNSYLECQELAKTDSRIKLYTKKNEGVSSTRNYGLSKSTGQYILFIDGDDYIEQNCIEKCMKIMLANNLDIIKFGIIKEINKKIAKKQKFSVPTNRIITKQEYSELLYPNIFNTNDFCNTTNAIIKKNIITNYFENYLIGEDFIFFVKCLQNSKCIYFSQDYFYHYVVNDNSATHIFNNQQHLVKLVDSLKVNENINKLFPIINKNHFINKCLENIYSNIDICILNNNYKEYNNYIKTLKTDKYLTSLITNNKITFPKKITKILSRNKVYYYKTKIINNIKFTIKKIITKF